MKNRAVIFGGAGFVGRYIVKELANLGYIIHVITRRPSEAIFLKTCAPIGQIHIEYINLDNDLEVERVIKNANIVINTIGLLVEKGENTFEKIHHLFPQRLASACIKYQVNKFIQFSALGVDVSQSKYAKTKFAGEQEILKLYGDNYTQGNSRAFIIRPSVIFGEEDKFFNMFACLATFSPVLPAIGDGQTKLQPVYVVDIAKAIKNIVANDAINPGIFELAGNDVMTMREIYKYVLRNTGLYAKIINIPFYAAKFMGRIMQLLPKPLLTVDQVESLKYDSIITNNNNRSLKDLGVIVSKLEMIVPFYLARFVKH